MLFTLSTCLLALLHNAALAAEPLGLESMERNPAKATWVGVNVGIDTHQKIN
jgi:hypothetical protein